MKCATELNENSPCGCFFISQLGNRLVQRVWKGERDANFQNSKMTIRINEYYHYMRAASLLTILCNRIIKGTIIMNIPDLFLAHSAMWIIDIPVISGKQGLGLN